MKKQQTIENWLTDPLTGKEIQNAIRRLSEIYPLQNMNSLALFPTIASIL